MLVIVPPEIEIPFPAANVDDSELSVKEFLPTVRIFVLGVNVDGTSSERNEKGTLTS